MGFLKVLLCEVRSTQLREEWEGKQKGEYSTGRLLTADSSVLPKFSPRFVWEQDGPSSGTMGRSCHKGKNLRRVKLNIVTPAVCSLAHERQALIACPTLYEILNKELTIYVICLTVFKET